MKGIISERGFDANDPDIINKVAKYIQNAAKYSFDYNRALDESDNIAVDFLKSYKQGVCQHYATAATMLYRALGIPARYTVGYTVFAKQDIPTNVTALMKHAWVEVYVDGFGWINVEVTGSAEFGSGINGGNEYEVEEDKPIEKPKLLIWPDSCSKSYDGTPLTYDKKTLSGNAAFRSLISSGFTYRFTVSGSQTEIGTSNSIVTSFTLYDRNQNDVTAEYEIIFSEGSLTVNDLEEIRIYISRHNYVYNGSFYTYESDEWTPIYIPEGVELRISKIKLSICDVGRYTSQMINENVKAYLSYTVNEKSTGIDVTKNYRIIVADYTTGEDYTVMQVTKREIKIKTNSATKVYDGTELRAEGYELSFGTLCEGHWISMVYTGSITDVGSTQNRVTRDIRIYYTDANGRNIDVTDNYNFPDPEFGTLTVTQS